MDVISLNPSDYHVLFFPNEENNKKAAYMDAILDLKAKYPEEFSGVKATEKEIDESAYPLNKNKPVLLIKKNGQTIAYLSGEKSKGKIMEYLEMTMKKNEETVMD